MSSCWPLDLFVVVPFTASWGQEKAEMTAANFNPGCGVIFPYSYPILSNSREYVSEFSLNDLNQTYLTILKLIFY